MEKISKVDHTLPSLSFGMVLPMPNLVTQGEERLRSGKVDNHTLAVFVDIRREVGIPLHTTVVTELSSFLILIHDLSLRTVTGKIMEIYKKI